MTRPDEQQSALLPPMKWNAWGDPEAAKPLSDGIRSLLKQALGVEDSPTAELELERVQLRPSALSATDRDALAAIVGAGHCVVDDRADCCGPVVSPPLTCCDARIPASRMRPTRCCCPATRMRSPRSCGTARSAASPSSRSAVAPAWSAAWIPSAASSRPWCRWTYGASTSCTRSTRSPARPNWAPVSPDRRPSACSASTASRSATSRRASSSPPSAASPRPGRRARTRPDTGVSTTWSAGCAR